MLKKLFLKFRSVAAIFFLFFFLNSAVVYASSLEDRGSYPMTTGSEEVDATAPYLLSGEELFDWIPAAGDSFVVDLSMNIGYLVHQNGDFYSFEVATGVRRYVYYIGLHYFAATPADSWVSKSLDIKLYDTLTFGPTGRFFRLYRDDKRTFYGIHAYGNEDWMFGEGDRYRSMGCIVVKEEVLDFVERTYHLNGESLLVDTRNSVKIESVESYENTGVSELLMRFVFGPMVL